MQTIKKTRSETIYPVHLCREDMEELIDLFKTKCKHMAISDSDYCYDSLDEITSKRGSKIRNLVIRGELPNVVLAFGSPGNISFVAPQSKILLQTHETTEQADGLFLAIKDLLDKKRWVVGGILGRPIIAIGLAAVTVWVLVLASLFLIQRGALAPVILTALMAGALYAGGTYSGIGFFSISLLRKSEVSSFWTRNRDDIIKILLAAALGVFGTLIVQHFTKH